MEPTTAPAGLGLLYAALAKAQGTFPKIEKNREVEIRTKERGSYKFRYADLAGIMDAVRPSLAREGLSIMQPLVETDGMIFIQTVLAHESGAFIESRLRVGGGYQDPKQFGAMISYMRRYAVSSMLCIAADDDIDEDGGELPQPANDNRAPRQRQQPEEQRPTELQPFTEEEFSKNMEAYRRAVEAGSHTPESLINTIGTRRLLSDAQRGQILALGAKEQA